MNGFLCISELTLENHCDITSNIECLNPEITLIQGQQPIAYQTIIQSN